MEKGQLSRRKHRKGHWNGQDISIEGLKKPRNREKAIMVRIEPGKIQGFLGRKNS
jgi:hypothetical protein